MAIFQTKKDGSESPTLKWLKKHQVKSKWYYWFWGICAVAVTSGQVYVGTGYRQMADSVDRLGLSLSELIRKST